MSEKVIRPYPLWEEFATDEQILDSAATKKCMKDDIDEHKHIDKNNAEFMDFASQVVSLTREDRLYLFRYFRAYRDKMKQQLMISI